MAALTADEKVGYLEPLMGEWMVASLAFEKVDYLVVEMEPDWAVHSAFWKVALKVEVWEGQKEY